MGVGGNSPVTQPQVQQPQAQPKQSMLSSFFGGLKKVGGAALNEFNRQQEAKFGDTSGTFANQLETSLPGKIATKVADVAKTGTENFKQNLKLISDPETQKQFTEGAGPLRQAAVNYTLAPIAQVPYNLKKLSDPNASALDKGGAAFNAALGVAQFIPGVTGVDDVVMAIYNGWKGTTLAQKQGMGTLDSYKEGASYLTGEKSAGLGDVAFNTPGMKTAGNIAELPLLIFGGLTVSKKKQIMESVKELEPEILRTIRGIKNYDKFSPATQMQIIQETTDIAKKVIPDIIKSDEMKKLGTRSPGEWMNTVSKFIEDRLVQAKNPEFNVGLNTRSLKKLPDEVVNAVPDGPVLAPGMKERGLITSVKESPDTSAAVKSTVEGNYPVISNAETKMAAEKAVADNPIQARDLIMGDVFNADVSAQGITLAKKLDLEGKTAEADAIWERLAEKATTAGQGNQALSMLGAGSPKVMENFAIKAINQANEARGGVINKLFGTKKLEFTEQLQKDIDALMLKARGLPEGEAKNAVIRDVLERIGKDIPPTASELVDAYRYNNMLSNPNTWGPTGRNMWYNLGQTFFTKPASMAFEVVNDVILSTLTGKARQAYISDVPKYYKAVFNAIPEAAQASLDILSGKSPIKHPDLAEATQRQLYDLLRESRQKNIPGNLDIIFGPKGTKLSGKNVVEAGKYTVTKAFSNLMEMNDRAFSTLIAAGEHAVQTAKGVPDAEAKQAADTVSQYFLGRSRVDPMNKSGQGKLLSAIDALEAWVASGRKHGPIKWMIPFINMATQTAKQTIEYSPAGLLTLWGNTSKGKQLAKAELGTAATMLSTLLVASNNVTWSAPTDPKERDLFFASGRKPYSIKIGNAWVPINTFGPLSLSIGTVAAWKYYHDQDPDKYTTSEYEKVRKTLTNQLARFGEQPMIQGLTNIAKALNGVMGKDAMSETTLPSSAAFTAGQVIPLNGLLRYISQVLDPVFRSVKGEGFVGSLQKDLPGLSKNLLPYLDPSGQPSKRNITDFASPYSMGFSNKTYDEIYQRIQSSKQIKGISSSAKSEINAIKGRIEIIAKDQSLSDVDRQTKLNIELEKIKKITGELEKNYQKVSPMITPR